MSFEVDHVFLATAAPEADEAALTRFGFRFTQRRVHRGQGNDNGLVSLQEDTEYVLELEFNGGREGRRHRFPAHLPLSVHW